MTAAVVAKMARDARRDHEADMREIEASARRAHERRLTDLQREAREAREAFNGGKNEKKL